MNCSSSAHAALTASSKIVPDTQPFGSAFGLAHGRSAVFSHIPTHMLAGNGCESLPPGQALPH